MAARKLLPLFFDLQDHLVSEGFGDEIEWQRRVAISEFSESDLLREHAWVVLCSGFKESAVRRCFDFVSLCFCDWASAAEIVNSRAVCVETALTAFRNRHKISAIAEAAAIIHVRGFSDFRADVLREPLETLQRLPYIGPVTGYHLAKNLGLSVAKPDRHLVRLAKQFGFADANEMCNHVSAASGEPTKVVDLVFWRAAALGRV